MTKLLAAVLVLAGFATQVPSPASTTILIFLIERPVGVEQFELRRAGTGFDLTANMDLTERGQRLQLASTLATTAEFTPTRFTSKGKSYRFVNVDTTVTVASGVAQVANLGATAGVRVPGEYFTATGYSRFLAGRC